MRLKHIRHYSPLLICIWRWGMEEAEREPQRQVRRGVWVSKRRKTEQYGERCLCMSLQWVLYLSHLSFCFLSQANTHTYAHTHTYMYIYTADWLRQILLMLLDSSCCPFAVLWGSSQNRWRKAAVAQHVSDRLLIKRCCVIFCNRLHLAPSASNHLTMLCWYCTGSDGKRAVSFSISGRQGKVS